ncbi:MAG: acetyl-CoA carboxylase carboxyltransferase subunit alpha [Desulfobacterales bacterium]|jgi:acetyl-CoA carboxylase carboxyl transferase subunit alpha|nr:acetyl-CoA carboxylase carboxyltransferase subunit alpha [Desulfobacterales bacterium]
MENTGSFIESIDGIESQIEKYKLLARDQGMDVSEVIEALERQRDRMFKNIDPWDRVKLARHPDRPLALDYIKALFEDFIPLHGDRLFADDKALMGGLARFHGQSCMVIGQQKGRDTSDRIYRNFGMCRPEGYRKAIRLMRMAARFNKPIIVFIDTQGAYPGIGAEERGQAEAIAKNLEVMSQLSTPIIVTVVGEGGSGGALGIGVGDRVLMLENAIYSVISPEGCAAILWRDAAMAPKAARALRMTAGDLLPLGIIDDIIREPSGGAHRSPEKQFALVGEALQKYLNELNKMDSASLISSRYDKFRKMGRFLG